MNRKFILKMISLCVAVCFLCIPVQGTDDWESDFDSMAVVGDLDQSGQVDNKDVEYLLWHTLFPEDYPLTVPSDFDGSGNVDNKDVEYLLWYTLFPEDYPLTEEDNAYIDFIGPKNGMM